MYAIYFTSTNTLNTKDTMGNTFKDTMGNTFIHCIPFTTSIAPEKLRKLNDDQGDFNNPITYEGCSKSFANAWLP